ncbi:uncharacterized protein ACLA_091450 [Aspergillus clavatus NRRL 1]|uniref:Myb-like domain-containing protein n=1 Tax=Aspergillus clavatus (strain ATCC 1007 / CBS 513.65 / DSM 816 / NCTC 3887 / NRRL 1 / QM 1276 / 107) TaxID=344612 RepID=A1CEZ8_ASPCL|nr:uncharacterized protein ACLA_091450 [Aspergillus clavatus NRRL 1]EAW11447.1 hypothetical protein ACLA_091450 [Aspergillus clavatus NRRL 1]
MPSGTLCGSQSQSQKLSKPYSATIPATILATIPVTNPAITPATLSDTQHAERLEQFTGNGAGSTSPPDSSTSRGFSTIDASIDALFSPENALTCTSTSGISSSDQGWQEFLQPADEQNSIPIDPLILTNNGFWETEDERLHIHTDGDAVVSETFYQYPDPPPLLSDMHVEKRNSNAYPEAQEGNCQSDSTLHDQSHVQISADDSPNSHTRASSNALEVPTSGEQSKCRKRKVQQSHGQPQLCKRARGSSVAASENSSFSSLCSHFTSVSADESLQFLSWLFEGALLRCLSESDSKIPECIVRPAHRLAQPADFTEGSGASRKGKPWSSEEANLLLRLRRDEKRPWSDVTRIFSDQFPGRSQGSIQVFWSSTLKIRA